MSSTDDAQMESASQQNELLAGKYRLLSRIGRGGMGEVWLAEEEGPSGFRRMVAVKKLLSAGEISDYVKDSFVAEAHVIARLDHPNIVRLIELGATDAGLYLVLDFVDGCSLDRLIKDTGAVSPVCAAFIGREVARALHAVHELADDDGVNFGVVHRDVSPANILIGLDGRVRLTDFGIARISGFVGDKTETGVLKGKLPYMPPEVASGERFDGRADIFSLGVTLIETLSGHRLRRAETQSQFIAMVATEPVPRVADVVADVPGELRRALDWATEFELERRCPTSAELEAAFEDALWEHGARPERTAIDELKERVGTSTGGSLSRSAKSQAYQEPSGPTPWSVRLDNTTPPSVASGIRPTPSATPSSLSSAPTTPESTIASPGSSSASGRAQSASAPRGLALPLIGMAVALLIGAAAAMLFLRADDETLGAASATAIAHVEATDGPATTEDRGAGSHDAPAIQTGTPAEAPTPNAPLQTASAAAPPIAPNTRPTAGGGPTPTATERDATEPGTLQVVAIPWANVSVDGRPIGVTPVPPVSLSPGKHSVTLVNSELGATRNMSVTIQSGKPSLLRVDLKRSAQ